MTNDEYLRSLTPEERFVDFMRAAADEGMTAYERRVRDKVANMCDGHSTERVIELVRSLI